MAEGYRILVVEDDAAVRRLVTTTLDMHGYAVREAKTATQALLELSSQAPDLAILDLGLPDGDGVDVIRSLRGWSALPVIVLSARLEDADKVAALDAGADDFMTKPFGMDELLARLRAVTRRHTPGVPGDPVVRLGDVTIDLAAKLVERQTISGPKQIRLTPTEWALLEVLARGPGLLHSQRHLLSEVWGPAYIHQPANLRLYMTQLRRKLEPEPLHPRYLLTEAGMGYRLRPDPAPGT